MTIKKDFLIATVNLERNRWGNREPSFLVSDWLERFSSDGFNGVELWENHYQKADEEERIRLESATPSIAVFNTYAGFGDEDHESRKKAALAITRLGSTAVKFNLGKNQAALKTYRKNLLAWADQLPSSCRLFCECHAGTVLERVEDAVAFFADLSQTRFGIIVHPVIEPATLENWFAAFGAQIAHLHVQMRTADTDPAIRANRTRMDACCSIVRKHGFNGSVTMEFTRGIGSDEKIETLYANACIDMKYFREQLSS